MQLLYKLYKIDKNQMESTLINIKKECINYECERIGKLIVAIRYDYMNCGYKQLLDIMSQFAVSQYIFTTSRFYNILKKIITRDIYVVDIKLNSVLQTENDTLSKYIRDLNQSNEKQKELQKLLKELEWYNYEECIDISSVSFKTKLANSSQYVRFHIYNNGIIAIDSELAKQQVFDLFMEMV